MHTLKELKSLYPLNKANDKKLIDILNADNITDLLEKLDSDMLLVLITYFVDRMEVYREKNYFEQKHIKILLNCFIYNLRSRQKDPYINRLSKFPYKTVKALEKISPSTIRLTLFEIACAQPKNETAVRIINQNPTFLYRKVLSVLSGSARNRIKNVTEIIANTTTFKLIAMDLGYQRFFELFGSSTIPRFLSNNNSCNFIKSKESMFSATAPLLLERAANSGQLSDLIDKAPLDFLKCIPISTITMMMKPNFPIALVPIAASVALTRGVSLLSYLDQEVLASAAKYFTEHFGWKVEELARAFVESEEIFKSLESRLMQLPVLCQALSRLLSEIAERDIERAVKLVKYTPRNDLVGSRLVCIMSRNLCRNSLLKEGLSEESVERAFFSVAMSGRQSFMLAAAVAVEDENLFRRFAMYAERYPHTVPLFKDLVTDLFGANRNHAGCVAACVLGETVLREGWEQREGMYAQLSARYTQCTSSPETIGVYTAAFIGTHRFAELLRPFKAALLAFPGHLLASLVIILSHADDPRSLLFRVRLFLHRNQ